MKRVFFILVIAVSNSLFGQSQQFVSSDIDNFWTAFDKVTGTKDTVLQRRYIKELYLDKGSPGLKSLILVRNYGDLELINSIVQYPKFWQSLRDNSLNTSQLYPEIDRDISGLKKIYPNLKPATIYFFMVAFLTGGTLHQDRVLI